MRMRKTTPPAVRAMPRLNALSKGTLSLRMTLALRPLTPNAGSGPVAIAPQPKAAQRESGLPKVKVPSVRRFLRSRAIAWVRWKAVALPNA